MSGSVGESSLQAKNDSVTSKAVNTMEPLHTEPEIVFGLCIIILFKGMVEQTRETSAGVRVFSLMNSNIFNEFAQGVMES